MRVDPLVGEGTAMRDWAQLAVYVEKLKRTVLLVFGYDRGAWMQRRKEGKR